MAKIQIVLGHLTAHFHNENYFVGNNEKIEFEILTNGLIKGKAVFFFNGKSFTVKDNIAVVPQEYLQAVNTVLIQDKTANGTVFKTWKGNEKLFLDLERLDTNGEKKLVAERQMFAKVLADYMQAKKDIDEMKAKHDADALVWQNERQKLAKAVVDLSTALADLNETVKAIKNEPLV